jgi:[acyl-carrier-protein] S-malonyltransferase
MLAAGIACYRAWLTEGGPEPAAVAGHSLGEYTALVAAGALSLADALPLVRLRAQAMQQAVPVGAGAMAAILGLDAATVRAVCAEVAAHSGEVVEPANFNDPRQTVISGSKAGVDLACDKLKALGAKRALLLAVSAPFHSSLMQPAALALSARLADVPLMVPRLPVVNNIDVAVQTEPAQLRDALVRQASGPVRWVEVIQALRDRGLRHIVECGPGRVLANLVRRIDTGLVAGGVHDPASLADTKGLVA